MKLLVLILSFSAFSLISIAQGVDVPEDYDLSKAEDYARYEEDVLKCIKWLEETPLNEEIRTREQATKFILDWMTGSPNVSILIDMRVLPFIKSSPDLLLTFMGGWTERALETEDYGNNLKGSVAGLEAVIEVYIMNLDVLGKDKHVKKLIKLEENGELEDWVKKQLDL